MQPELQETEHLKIFILCLCMAEEVFLNTTEIWQSLEPSILNQLHPLITIFKAVGIAVLVYVVFLIIRALFRWRTMNKVAEIAKDVKEINKKMDALSEKSEKNKKKKK